MKKKYLSCLLAGVAAQSFGLYSTASASFYVIPVSREAVSTSCTGPGEVESAGQCWMDRNLGASQVATSSTDELAYGDLYQWGRLGNGHQNRTSATTDVLSENDVPGHNDFIVSTVGHLDWREPQNDNLWQGLGGVNNPCPQGFRLPTESELQTEVASWASQDAAGAFGSPLKLVLSGYRHYNDGLLTNVTTYGYLWTSNVSGDSVRRLYFNSSEAVFGIGARGAGFPVRCIKD